MKNKLVYPISAKKGNDRLKKWSFSDSYFIRKFKSLVLTEIPKKVDLRDSGLISEVFDQGNLESSVGIALVKGCLEYCVKKDLGLYMNLSCLFVHRKDRTGMFPSTSKSTTSLIDGIEVLSSIGCCPEAMDGYSFENFTYPSISNCDDLAIVCRIKKCYRLNGLKEIKHCLSEGYPVASLFNVYPSMFDVFVYRSGEIPLPEALEKPIGQHSMAIVGFDDDKRHLIVKNSWSKSWGEFGYGFIPYSAVDRILLESFSLRVL